MAKDSPALEPGRNCWRIAAVDRATVIVDAERYFHAARSAMLKAKRQILLVGWDFDARIHLAPGETDLEGPPAVGDFIYWLVERTPGLHIHLLRWNLGALKTLARGRTLLTVARWMTHKRIHTKLDGFHPPAASHHQKIVVIDDCLAFCGGIDMTSQRWDTRDHRDENPLRRLPRGPFHGPWHDATTALQGPVAAALGELCRERWTLAGGEPIAPISPGTDCWPDQLDPDFKGIEVAISRSSPEMPGHPPVREIEALYLDLIARATRHIYAESQYFASRRIAEAIARRLDEAAGPEIVIINPVKAQGWLEPIAMDTARARLFAALKKRDPHGRLRLYHPHTAGGQPIYVHAKILVIDDQVLRVGSSNFNNRSMRLDTECDVTIDATLGADPVCIRAIRDGLIAEHVGCAPDEVAAAIDAVGLIGAIEQLRASDGRTLANYEMPELAAIEKWLADNEVLDPDGPDEMFESLARRGLFRHARFWRRGK